MLVVMEIEKHIKQAESIFINGKTFDNERRDFIKNLNTCDLLAVPGSGKTTALLAKLYCLAQNMPFEDGSGILVLAHTNHAVEEIEKKLKKHCPNLFEYPSFIGTIQSFVNKFLANQACFEKYGSYIRQNEDVLIEELITKKILSNKNTKIYGLLNSLIKSKHNILSKEYLLEKGINNTQELLQKYIEKKIVDKNFVLQNVKERYNEIISLPLKEKQIVFDFNNYVKTFSENRNEFLSLIKEITYDNSNECFRSDKFPNGWKKKLKFDTPSGVELKAFFEDLRKNGFLKYRDSFELGNYHLNKYNTIKTIIGNRFKFLFIDEMQDLDTCQIELIDQMFSFENSKTVIQRIGDINQSIYNSGKKVKVECDWKARFPTYLNNSNRLTYENAKLINGFTLDPQNDLNNIPRFKVVGKNIIENPIKPHLVVFDKKTSGNELQNKFELLIQENELDKTESAKKNGFKIIGWSTVWGDDEQKSDKEGIAKIRLKDLFPDYSKESKSKKDSFDCLKKHVQLFDHEKQTLEAVRKSILNALVRVLTIEDIHKEPNKLYRKSSLMEFIKNKGENDYDLFKSKLFDWCFRIVVNKEYESTFQEIKTFLYTDFIKWNWTKESIQIPQQIIKSKEFIDSSNYEFIKLENNLKPKIEPKKAFEIEINSVHAVKGQTHCATMYIETSYHDYESKKSQIKSVLCGDSHSFKIGEKKRVTKGKVGGEKDVRGKEALKMMYVGFSRPTHLLCFAVLKENVSDSDIAKMKKIGWEVDMDLVSS